MDEVKFLNDIEILRKLSLKIEEIAGNEESLVYSLNNLSPEVKTKNHNHYQSAKGPILTILKKVSSILVKDRYISKEKLEEIISGEKRKSPNSFRGFKRWYNIICPLILEEYADEVASAMNGISDFTLTSLNTKGKLTVKPTDFKTGKRGRGDTSCWFAFYNNTHRNQQTAKQLFLHIYSGKVEYFFYDRPLKETVEINSIPYNTPFNVDHYLSVFSEYLSEILNDNYVEEDNYQTVVMDQMPIYKTKTDYSDYPLNQILYGPPGTGKTYNTINKAIQIVENLTNDELKTIGREELKNKFNDLLINDWKEVTGQIAFVTFHQSMCYEDFIEGIKPSTDKLSQTVTYDIEPGIFKKIAEVAYDNWKDANKGIADEFSFNESFEKLKEEWEENPAMSFPMKRKGNDYTILGFTERSICFKKASGGTGHTLSISTLSDYYYGIREISTIGLGIYYPPLLKKLKSYKPVETKTKRVKPYVLIIDEINRGNVSQIFGELITLIEKDKRLDSGEALEVTLPYSKEKFGVPPNLYIIGTMNTADRSVEALDTALRRRFCFEEIPPNPELPELEKKISLSEGTEIELKQLLVTINNRLEILLDKNHLIGHSYFININTSKKLQGVFHRNILPLLQEYFFGDYGKIGLVLGKGFVETDTPKTAEEVFANFEYEDASEFVERTIYRTKDVSKMAAAEFEDAIRSLLKM